ncbi:MAG: hypothetical protein HQL32_17315 [Planctomycetes bacterium]|nr:hypothetical protein [Planctomycetota bacterium]
MKNDFIILGLVLFVIAALLFTFFGLGQKKYQDTVWIDKKSGDGPYEMRSGSRSAEAKKDIQEGGDGQAKELELPRIKKTTSAYEVNFSTTRGELDKLFYNEGETFPEVKY